MMSQAVLTVLIHTIMMILISLLKIPPLLFKGQKVLTRAISQKNRILSYSVQSPNSH